MSEVLVVGAGAMGCAAAWELSRRGASVTVLDQFAAGHARGSSHGTSRIFRLGYTLPAYVELVQAALPLWRDLEAVSGLALLEQLGALDHGADLDALRAGYDATGARAVTLSADEVAARWPGLRSDGPALLQPDGGRLHAARTLQALRAEAERHGAVFHDGLGPVSLVAGGATDGTTTWPGDVVVVATGAWAGSVLPDIGLPPLTVTQEQVAYFAPRPGIDPSGWPSLIHRNESACYALWTPGIGMKVGEHGTGVVTTGDDRDFAIDPTRLDRVAGYVAQWLPGLDPTPVLSETCLYTTTPTEDFVIDRVADVVVAAGFSGHGFKFTPLVGRWLADLALGTGTGPAFLTLAGRASAAPPRSL